MDKTDEILEERGKTHGNFNEQACTSQILKNYIHAHPNWHTLSYARKEALDMILHKIARIMNGDPDHHDHWDDIAGYARLAR